MSKSYRNENSNKKPDRYWSKDQEYELGLRRRPRTTSSFVNDEEEDDDDEDDENDE